MREINSGNREISDTQQEKPKEQDQPVISRRAFAGGVISAGLSFVGIGSLVLREGSHNSKENNSYIGDIIAKTASLPVIKELSGSDQITLFISSNPKNK